MNKSNLRRELMIISKKYGMRYRKPRAIMQQSSSTLTLDEVCPTWAAKLKVGLTIKDRRILSYDSKYCLVGEAWGFTGRHAGYYFAPLIPFIGCWTCIKYGKYMGKLSREKKTYKTDDFQPLITRFLEHWNQKHKHVTESLRDIRCIYFS